MADNSAALRRARRKDSRTKHERAARNVYLDAPDEQTGTTPDVADDEPSVEQNLQREERMNAIRTHVTALPERQRMAVLLSKFEGMSYAEIAAAMELSPQAIKSLLSRARENLREALQPYVEHGVRPTMEIRDDD